jgi:maleylpyruvate isomerase
MIRLYGYFRSGTSHRLRIALNYKGIHFEQISVNLSRNEQLGEEFGGINPQRFVPVLDVDGQLMTQSPALIEWLEDVYPDPPLLPLDPRARAHVRAMAAIVGCDIHPLNNKRVLDKLRRQMSIDEEGIRAWCSAWISAGFDAYEALLRAGAQGERFSYGNSPTIADVYLVPQVESARRFGVDTTRWRRLHSINAACLELEPFALAAPAVQPDAF